MTDTPVLHVIDTTGPGGAETVFLQLADGLRGRGWKPRMAVVGRGWVLDRVRELDLPVDLLPTEGRLDVRYARTMAALVRRHDIRLIQAHLFSPAVYTSAVGLWTGTPVAATFHGNSDIDAGSFGRRLRFRLLARAARVVCVSESLGRELARTGLVPANRARVIHNGVDMRAFGSADGEVVRREHGVPVGAVLVGALGNVRPAKDYATLLRAAAILRDDPRLRFAIVGERTEPLYGELLALRSQLGLEDRVSFWGFREDVPEILAAFDVLAISSSTEGFSIAAIQAMAAGTPVVATRSGGPEGIITDGQDGVLVAPGSPESLAAGLRRCAEDPEWAAQLAVRAQRTVRDRFSLESMLDAYESLYDELLAPRSSHASSTPGTSAASSST